MNTELLEDIRVEQTLTIDESRAKHFIDNVTIDQIEHIEGKVAGTPVNEVEALNAMFLVEKLCNGLYARALTIPKGCFLTGKVHKEDYIDIFVSGDVTVKSFLNDGTVEPLERVDDFRFFEGKAGRKRVLIAHETTLWITVDPSAAKDVSEAEDSISVFNITEYNKLLEESVA